MTALFLLFTFYQTINKKDEFQKWMADQMKHMVFIGLLAIVTDGIVYWNFFKLLIK